MLSIFFSLTLATTCPSTVIINKTLVWSERDQDELALVKKRCPFIYKNSPCLKTFIKVEELTYRAICGKKG